MQLHRTADLLSNQIYYRAYWDLSQLIWLLPWKIKIKTLIRQCPNAVCFWWKPHSIAAELWNYISVFQHTAVCLFFSSAYPFLFNGISYPILICCFQQWSAFLSVWMTMRGLTQRDEQETDVQEREVIRVKKSDIMFLVVLQRLAIMCSSLYSCAMEILGSLLNRVLKPQC